VKWKGDRLKVGVYLVRTDSAVIDVGGWREGGRVRHHLSHEAWQPCRSDDAELMVAESKLERRGKRALSRTGNKLKSKAPPQKRLEGKSQKTRSHRHRTMRASGLMGQSQSRSTPVIITPE